MSILAETVDSRLEHSNETFSFRKQCNYTKLLVHNYERFLRKGRICRDFCPFVFLREVNKMWRKAKTFSAFLGNDKWKLMDFWQHTVTPQRIACINCKEKNIILLIWSLLLALFRNSLKFWTCHSNRTQSFSEAFGKIKARRFQICSIYWKVDHQHCRSLAFFLFKNSYCSFLKSLFSDRHYQILVWSKRRMHMCGPNM